MRCLTPWRRPVSFADFSSPACCSLAKTLSDAGARRARRSPAAAMFARHRDARFGACGSTSWHVPLVLALPSASGSRSACGRRATAACWRGAWRRRARRRSGNLAALARPAQRARTGPGGAFVAPEVLRVEWTWTARCARAEWRAAANCVLPVLGVADWDCACGDAQRECFGSPAGRGDIDVRGELRGRPRQPSRATRRFREVPASASAVRGRTCTSWRWYARRAASWACKLVAPAAMAGAVLAFTAMEITRRFLWSMFRVEKAYLARWGAGIEDAQVAWWGLGEPGANQSRFNTTLFTTNAPSTRVSLIRRVARLRLLAEKASRRAVFVWSAEATVHPVAVPRMESNPAMCGRRVGCGPRAAASHQRARSTVAAFEWRRFRPRYDRAFSPLAEALAPPSAQAAQTSDRRVPIRAGAVAPRCPRISPRGSRRAATAARAGGGKDFELCDRAAARPEFAAVHHGHQHAHGAHLGLGVGDGTADIAAWRQKTRIICARPRPGPWRTSRTCCRRACPWRASTSRRHARVPPRTGEPACGEQPGRVCAVLLDTKVGRSSRRWWTASPCG